MDNHSEKGTHHSILDSLAEDRTQGSEQHSKGDHHHHKTNSHNKSVIEQKNHGININKIDVPFELDKKGKHIEKEYWNYLKNTGIQTGFEIVFNEIVAKKLPEDQVFAFAAQRLREIGAKLKEIDQL